MSALSIILNRYTTIPADLRAQLSAELAGMERDAGRYVWLRHGDNDETVMLTYVGSSGARPFDPRFDPCWLPRNFKLDEAIDAAMTKGK